MNEIEKAIEYFEIQKRLFPNSFNVLSGYFDLAIEALKEKQEREKMKCENCKFELSNFTSIDYPCEHCSNAFDNNFQPKESENNG